MKVKSESEVAQLCPTLATPWTAVHQAPPSMGFSRQEYWSRVPLASPSLAVREMQTKNIVRYHLTPARMAIIKKLTINAGESVEKRESSYTVGGNVNW